MRWMIWFPLVAIAAWGDVSCGGNTTSENTGSSSPSTGGSNAGGAGATGTSAGTSSMGGNTGAGGACPTAPVCPIAPAPQGSASIHFNGPGPEAAMAGKQCAAGVHWANAPSTFASDQMTTGSSRPSDTIVDGEKSRQFTCRVAPSGGGKFAVSASISVPAFDKDNLPLPIPTRIQLQTTIAQDESGAPGSLVVSDNDTVANYESVACTFSVKSDTTLNKRLAIGAGKAWGSVTCASLADKQSPVSSCTVDVGYFILENCSQE